MRDEDSFPDGCGSPRENRERTRGDLTSGTDQSCIDVICKSHEDIVARYECDEYVDPVSAALRPFREDDLTIGPSESPDRTF
ncbi:unnamed protein product [Lota lota]